MVEYFHQVLGEEEHFASYILSRGGRHPLLDSMNHQDLCACTVLSRSLHGLSGPYVHSVTLCGIRKILQKHTNASFPERSMAIQMQTHMPSDTVMVALCM